MYYEVIKIICNKKVSYGCYNILVGQDKLEKSPDLAAPITEAQEQLQRLKQLMFSIFGSGLICQSDGIISRSVVHGIHDKRVYLKVGQHSLDIQHGGNPECLFVMIIGGRKGGIKAGNLSK